MGKFQNNHIAEGWFSGHRWPGRVICLLDSLGRICANIKRDRKYQLYQSRCYRMGFSFQHIN